MKKFINPNWKELRKLDASLKQAWFYIWDQADAIGVYTYDPDYLAVDLAVKISFEELLKLPKTQKIAPDKILLLDFIEVNYGSLKHDYNPHKPAFRALDANQLYLNSSLNQACPKLEDEDEDKDKDENQKKKGVKKEKSEKPINDVPIIQMEELWSKFLSDHHSVSYYASAKERVALKAIAKQLLFQVGQKEAQTGQISNKTDADKVLEAWSYVLSKFDRWSDFHKNLKALSAINSQLTTILSDSKNGANKQKSNGPLDPAKVAADYLRSRGIADPIDRVPAQNGPNETFDADYQIVD